MTVLFPHFGILVEDLERSARFYVEALGFELATERTRASDVGQLVGLPGADAETLFVSHPSGGRIELHRFTGYDVVGERARPANTRGLSHLCFVVDDLVAVGARIRQHGGEVIEQSAVAKDYGKLVFCRDPDGVRIELVQMTGTYPAAG